MKIRNAQIDLPALPLASNARGGQLPWRSPPIKYVFNP